MLFPVVFAILTATAGAVQSNPHAKLKQSKPVLPLANKLSVDLEDKKRHKYLTKKTAKFLVNGTHFPQVPFDIGESYAGLLGNTPSGQSELFFWFFPTRNPSHDNENEITVWLNGGPGCSSLDGLLQENGPFLWQSGVYQPVCNPYSFNNLTNVVYIDQPAGTGFSPGPATVRSEIDVSNQFNDFWKRFIDTFDMQGYKVYITGESYAGQYIPYIAEGFIKKKDKTHFNLKGIQINDPSMNDDSVMIYAPAVAALNHFSSVFSLNDTFMKHINAVDAKCGYTDFLNKALTFPPPSKFPNLDSANSAECDTWDQIISAATLINPCFNVYHLTDFCPFLWDEMGFPSVAEGPNDYFDQPGVQAALHLPPTNYSVCGKANIFPNGDSSIPSALGPLPKVIEATNNVLIGHGWYDYLLFMNGSLATIQNMTWNGAQRFQHPPTGKLFVPYNGESQVDPVRWSGGSGILGTTHTERGLTFSTVYRSGHEIPQYVPGAAYRQLEFLLGRIKDLSAE